MSTTGVHNHPPHVKNASGDGTGSKMELSGEQQQQQSSAMQTFASPMSNQIQSMPTATATSAMINQQQMNVSMNFIGNATNNFSMTSILNPQLSEMDPLLAQHSTQLDSNIQITPIINASIDNLQMHHQQQQQQQQVQQQQQQQQQLQRGANMHVDAAITSENN
jgi:hypothetical protein